MNVVHSLWTGTDRFRTERGPLVVWTLSLALLREHYDRVELVTDDGGLALADTLGWRYTSYVNGLTHLGHRHPGLGHVWALGKLAAALHQTGPFVQVDGDVLLYRPLPPRCADARIVAQSIDHQDYYRGSDMEAALAVAGLPDARVAYNCGVIGGRDVDLVRRYAREAIGLAERFAGCPVNGTTTSMVVEQYHLGDFGRRNGVRVETLLPVNHKAVDRAAIGYDHLTGDSKRDPARVSLLERLLADRYPEEYERLLAGLDRIGIGAENHTTDGVHGRELAVPTMPEPRRRARGTPRAVAGEPAIDGAAVGLTANLNGADAEVAGPAEATALPPTAVHLGASPLADAAGPWRDSQALAAAHRRAVARTTTRSQGVNISVINESRLHLGLTLAQLCAVGDSYLAQILEPLWPGTLATLIPTKVILPHTPAIVLMDDDAHNGELGYRSRTPDGLPLVHVYVRPALTAGKPLTAVFTQQLAALRIDPDLNRHATAADGTVYAYEPTDPVDEDAFVLDGAPVANVVTPAWFQQTGRPKFDYMGRLPGPFTLTPGGSALVRDGDGWRTAHGSFPKSERPAMHHPAHRATVRRANHAAATQKMHAAYVGQ